MSSSVPRKWSIRGSIWRPGPTAPPAILATSASISHGVSILPAIKIYAVESGARPYETFTTRVLCLYWERRGNALPQGLSPRKVVGSTRGSKQQTCGNKSVSVSIIREGRNLFEQMNVLGFGAPAGLSSKRGSG